MIFFNVKANRFLSRGVMGPEQHWRNIPRRCEE